MIVVVLVTACLLWQDITKKKSSNCLFDNKNWKGSQSWDLPDLEKSIASRTWIVRKKYWK